MKYGAWNVLEADLSLRRRDLSDAITGN